MLDKIKSLGLNVNNPKSNKYYSVYDRARVVELKTSDQYDSMQRSEALEYLYQLNWRIKSINFLSENKLAVTIDANEIEFRTVFDLTEHVLNEIEYSVGMVKKDDPLLKKLTTALSISLSSDYKFSPNYENELGALKVLFKRLFDLNIASELTSDDSTILSHILDDISPEVYTELFRVSHGLIVFIYKLTGTKLIVSQLPVDQAINISRVKISAIN